MAERKYKRFDELKVGDKVGVYGYFPVEDEEYYDYEFRRDVIREIELYPLHPSKTGMFKKIRTNQATFIDVSKNGCVHENSTRTGRGSKLYADPQMVAEKILEMKNKQLENVRQAYKQDVDDLEEEIEQLEGEIKVFIQSYNE